MSGSTDRVSRVKGCFDIRRVVGEWVALSPERNGKSMGLCPFHGDKRASMVVNAVKQSFKCFACGESGDVITFVMLKEGCSFPEALSRLEVRAGIASPSSSSSSSFSSSFSSSSSATTTSSSEASFSGASSTTLRLAKPSLASPQSTTSQSTSPTPSLLPASQSPKLLSSPSLLPASQSPELLSSPSLLTTSLSPSLLPSASLSSSLSPSTPLLSESLSPTLPGRGLFGEVLGQRGTSGKAVVTELTREELLAANAGFLKGLHGFDPGCVGLGVFYMEFEVGFAPRPSVYRGHAIFKWMLDRVVFPLRDANGVLVGFSARHKSAVPPPSGWGRGCPKYINSASSMLFRKREVLYGFYRAKEAIRRAGFGIAVEGYKDVIAMHAAGFTNTVGLCGLELTREHMDLLAGLCCRVVLLTDGDERGQAALPKLEGLLKKVGFDVLSLSLPAGEDPDSLFRSLGAAGLSALIRSLMVPPDLTEPLLSPNPAAPLLPPNLTAPLPPPPSETAAVVRLAATSGLGIASESATGSAAGSGLTSGSGLGVVSELTTGSTATSELADEAAYVSDIDRLTASLAFISRPSDREVLLRRMTTLSEKLRKVSIALKRPPSCL